MKSNLDPALLAAYRDTDYVVSDDPPLVLRVDEQNDDVRILFASFGVETGAFLTAWNPGSQKLDTDENDDLQAALLSEVEQLRHNYLVGYGERDDWREYSYLILGICQEDATALAHQFGQHAYIWISDTGIPELVTVM